MADCRWQDDARFVHAHAAAEGINHYPIESKAASNESNSNNNTTTTTNNNMCGKGTKSADGVRMRGNMKWGRGVGMELPDAGDLDQLLDDGQEKVGPFRTDRPQSRPLRFGQGNGAEPKQQKKHQGSQSRGDHREGGRGISTLRGAQQRVGGGRGRV